MQSLRALVINCLLIFVCGFANGQAVSFYQAQFRGGVTGCGYSPDYSGGGTGTYTVCIVPGSGIHKAYLFAGRQGVAPALTLTFNGSSLTFDSTNQVSPTFQSPDYGGNSAVHAIDVSGLVSAAQNSYTIVVPNTQSSTSDRFNDFYLYIAYDNNTLPLVNTAIFVNAADMQQSVNDPLALNYPISNTANVGLALNLGYACDPVTDAEIVTANGTNLGMVGGPNSNSTICAGPYGDFAYANGILSGLLNCNANQAMDSADALSNIQALVANNSTSVEVDFQHSSGSSPSDNAIWAIFLTWASDSLGNHWDTTIQCSSSIQLNVPAGDSVVWSPPNGLSCTTCTNPIATVNGSVTYIATITSNCLTYTDTFNIYVTNSNFSFDTAICQGESIQLFVSSGGGSILWSPSAGLSCDTCANPIASLGSSATYVATVTGSSCGNFTDTFNVLVHQFSLTTTSVNTICGNNQGSATANAGGNGPFLYIWSNQDTTQTISNLSGGIYTVTVSNAFGCSATAFALVGSSAGFTISVSGTNVTCGNINGSATVTVSGGVSPFVYDWSNGATTQIIINLAAQNYAVTVTDSSGCSVSGSFTVSQAAPLVITNPQIQGVSCQDSGYIVAFAAGGTGTLTYTWSPGNLSGDSIGNLTSGGYTLTVTDSTGCSATAYYIVGRTGCGGCPAVNTNNNVNMSCGQNCITLTATAFSGAQTDSYTVAQIAYNPPFAYNIGTQILVAQDDIWSSVITLPFNFCYFGQLYNEIIVGSNGLLSFNIFNTGTGNSWSIPGPAPLNGVPADLDNCIMSPWQDLDPTYHGQIFYQISGEAPCRKFEVSWYDCPMFGDSGSVDTDYCSMTDHQTQMIVIYETTNVIDIYIKEKDTVCTDKGIGRWNNDWAIEGIQNASGSIFYGVPGRDATIWTAQNDAWRFTPAGPANYVITWYQGSDSLSTGDTLTVCPDSSTTYTVYALYTNCDNSTVLVSDSVFVTTGGTLTVSIDSTHNVLCYGDSDGAVYASYHVNGTSVTSFGWSPGGANLTALTNIPAGTYIFSATTLSGCTVSDTVTITAPPQIIIQIPGDTVNTCGNDINVGTLYAIVSGGVGPYSYSWSDNLSTDTITGLASGAYGLTVTDSNGCSTSAIGLVDVIDHILTIAPIITEVSCNGGSNGRIIALTNGSTAPLSYVWVPGTSTSDTLSNLTAGIYCVTATDFYGCTVDTCLTITQPTPITLDSSSSTQATCTTGGCIIVSASGGTGSLIYFWSDAQTGDSICGLAGGPYTLTISDQNACSITDSFTVTAAPGVVVFGNPIIITPTCNGDSGSIMATASGGTPPITFIWSTGTTGDSILGVPSGNYSVTITDALGCSASTTYILNQPNPVILQTPIIDSISCNNGSNGSITVLATGGTGTISYVWNTGATGATISNLSSGTYCVTATDSLGCNTSACYTLNNPPPIVINSATITNVTCQGLGSIIISAGGGTGILHYNWSNGMTGDTITGLSAGTDSLTITDANGCSVTANYVILPGAPPVTIDTAIISNVLCNGGSSGSISITAGGGTGTLNFLWSNGDNTATISGLTAGNYCLTITDSIGCTDTACYTVTQPTAITVTDTVITPVTCIAGGTIVVTASGGTGTLIYVWSNSQSGDSIGGLVIGNYTVTITDANGCSISATYAVPISPNAINLGNPIVGTIACFGGTATINPNATGGIGSLAYSWSNLAATPTITVGIGTYCVTVTDSVGCSVSACYTLTQPTQLTATLAYKALICSGATDTATVTATGGTGQYTYSWTPASGNTNVATGLTAGNFSVTVTDSAGCVASASGTITAEPAITSTSTVNSNPCSNPPMGNVTITPGSGLGPLTYTLLPSGPSNTTGIFNALSPGTYNYSIADTLGCSAIDSFTIAPGITADSFNLTVDSVSCYGFHDGSITVNTLASHNPPFTYSLNEGTALPGNVFDSLPSGYDTITVTNGAGCAYSIDTFVGQPNPVSVNFVPDTVYTYSNTATPLNLVTANFTNPVYLWTPGQGLSCTDCANDSATVTAPAVYYVTVSDSANKNCTASDSVIVLLRGQFQMPDAFTPNGDGHNDLFAPISLTYATVTAFRIYDRWGACVHNSTDPWDGKFKGKDQPPGTYIYYIEAKYTDPNTDQPVDKKQQGTVILLR